MPAGAVIPVLVYPNVAEAVDWLCDKFAFTLRWPAGNHRAQIAIGDSAVAITAGELGPGFATPDSVMVRIDDADAHHEHARERGARILSPPSEYPYGERQYTAEDLAGRRWTFSQSIADVAPEEWGGTTAAN